MHWNENMKRGYKVLFMLTFAELYRLSHRRLQRELKAGFTGVLLRDGARGGWIHTEYRPPAHSGRARPSGCHWMYPNPPRRAEEAKGRPSW